jgi:hypothetical protein
MARGVNDRLRAVLEYVTGDRWTFTFRHRRWRDEKALQHFLPRPAAPRNAVVLPYSGGLDSFAEFMRLRLGESGVFPILMTAEHGGGVLRNVSSSLSIAADFAHVSMPIRLSPGEHAETSYRTRTFLFFCVAALAGKLCGANRINVAEAGQGAVGVAMVPYGGEHPYLTTHPRFTGLLRQFLVGLWGDAPEFCHPNVWRTKGELLAHVHALRGMEGWRATRSCARNVRRLKEGAPYDHCGICGGCLLRRVSLHAASLVEDAGTSYAWNDYSTPDLKDACASSLRTTETDREIATCALLSHDHLAQLADAVETSNDVDRVSFELAPVVSMSFQEARQKVVRLLKEHKREWDDFVAHLPRDGWAATLIKGGH